MIDPRSGADAHGAGEHGEYGEYDGPSKSSRKREMHALQDIGAQLVALSPDRLAKVSLPENLLDAVKDARRFSMEARRRQMQYIGKLMRHIDPAPIQAQLDAFNGVSKAEVARHHRLERLRADFIADEKTIGAIVEAWPQADLQHLRTLRRNAIKEQAQGKPPRAFREIFQVLRQLDERHDEPSDDLPGAEADDAGDPDQGDSR